MKTIVPPCPQCGQQIDHIEYEPALPDPGDWTALTTLGRDLYKIYPCEHKIRGDELLIDKVDDGSEVETIVYRAVDRISHSRRAEQPESLLEVGRWDTQVHTADHASECPDC